MSMVELHDDTAMASHSGLGARVRRLLTMHKDERGYLVERGIVARLDYVLARESKLLFVFRTPQFHACAASRAALQWRLCCT